MIMKNLDKWLSIDSKLDFYHFHLDWTKIREPRIEWSSEFDKNLQNFHKHKIYWKEYNTNVYIHGCFKENVQMIKLSNLHENTYPDTPFLKSLIQKSIRRSNKSCAIKGLKHLIKQDIQQTFRRMSIIMVEDVEICDTFHILVWFSSMLNYMDEIPLYCIEWLLGLTSSLCDHPIKFNAPHIDNAPKKILTKIPKDLVNKEILYTIQLRKSYGGLKGDMRMLDGLSMHIINNDPIIPHMNHVFLDFVKVPALKLSEWELSAVDFHVCSIDNIISKKTGIPRDKVKSLMWTHRSSINSRSSSKNYDNKGKPNKNSKEYLEYKNIEKLMKDLSKWILDKKFNTDLIR
jgi:hypothetical protein